MLDHCNFDAVAKDFTWALQSNQRLIVSSNVDGVASAMLLNAAVRCEVDGVYTLNDLWTNRGLVKGHPEPDLATWGGTFLDHDINRTTIRSVGHHLLQWSAATLIPGHTEGNASLNPNLLRGVTFNHALRKKYPFGTVHFLLGLLGQVVGFQYSPSPMMATLLMHVHSSFVNALNYPENALDWLEWLGGSGERSPLRPVCKVILRFNPRRMLRQFKQLADAFEGIGLEPRSQGEFKDLNDTNQVARLRSLIRWLCDETGWPDPFGGLALGTLQRIPMDRQTGKPTKGTFMEILDKAPFSYAILGRGGKSFNYNWFEGHGPRR